MAKQANAKSWGLFPHGDGSRRSYPAGALIAAALLEALNPLAAANALSIQAAASPVDSSYAISIDANSPADAGSWPTGGDKYVSSTGSNGAAGTIGAPYATVTFALTQITGNQVVRVMSNITENLTLSSLSAGSSGAYKTVLADTPGIIITGTVDGSSAGAKYLKFKGFHWLNGSNETDITGVTFVKFVHCGFQGGVASAGNNAQHLAGTDQLYESCYWVTAGGRYATICFEQQRCLYRWCIVRADNWGAPADDGNPSAAFQLYSANNCARIQCVAVDCVNQRSNNEWLGGFTVTTNTGVSVGILDQEVITVNGPSGQIGIQVEGSNNCTYQGLGNISVKNGWGFVANLDSAGGSVSLDGGEYSRSANSGVAAFGVESVSPCTNINTTSNTGGNFNGVTGGSGCTTAALNMNTRITNMVKRGVSETMYNETGWNVQQSGQFMFPLPVESLAYTKYLAFKTARGWTADTSLTNYLKGIT